LEVSFRIKILVCQDYGLTFEPNPCGTSTGLLRCSANDRRHFRCPTNRRSWRHFCQRAGIWWQINQDSLLVIRQGILK